MKIQYHTLCNAGYKELTENMLRTAFSVGIDPSAWTIWCNDPESESYFLDKFPTVRVGLFAGLHGISEFCDFSFNENNGFARFTTNKICLICSLVAGPETDDVHVFVDGDIGFYSNPENEILHYLRSETTDGVFQEAYTDTAGPFCTGFFAVKNSHKNHQFWTNLLAYAKETHEQTETRLNDQILLNYYYKAAGTKPNYYNFNRIGFPDGKYYFEKINDRFRDKALMFHANWVVGKEAKIERLKQVKLWKLN